MAIGSYRAPLHRKSLISARRQVKRHETFPLGRASREDSQTIEVMAPSELMAFDFR